MIPQPTVFKYKPGYVVVDGKPERVSWRPRNLDRCRAHGRKWQLIQKKLARREHGRKWRAANLDKTHASAARRRWVVSQLVMMAHDNGVYAALMKEYGA